MAYCDVCRKELGYNQIISFMIGQQRVTACSECKYIIDQTAVNDSAAKQYITSLIQQDIPMKRIRRALVSLIDHSVDSLDAGIMNDIYYSATIRVSTTKDRNLIIAAITADGNYNKLYIPFPDILNCEIQEDGITVQRSGMAGAIVGALIADTAGAVIGATTRKSTDWVAGMNVCIFASGIPNGHLILSLAQNIKRNSSEYLTAKHHAQNIYNAITAIIAENKRNQNSQAVHPAQNDVAAKLRELKQLLDDGLISQDEFNEMRQNVLKSF